MKKLLTLSFIALTLFACKKDAATTNGGSTANGANTFTWTDNTVTYNCDSAYASAQYKTIFVYKGGSATRYFFEINLTGILSLHQVMHWPILDQELPALC